jgi:hypothetical protein
LIRRHTVLRKYVVTSSESSQPADEGGMSGVGLGADDTALFDLLAVRDVDPSDSVTFQLTALPQHGTLYLGENPLGLGGTFSQFDIDNGVLTYESGLGELGPGTYRAGDTAGLPDDQHDIAWSGIDVYGIGSAADMGHLDISAADLGRVAYSAQGIVPSTTGDALVLDFRAEVSGVRVDFHDGQESRSAGEAHGHWEAYNVHGSLVDAGVLGGAREAHSDPASIAAADGGSFRYLLLRADEPTVSEGAAGDGLYVRTVEYDVVPPPVADAFAFRGEDGQALGTVDSDPAALGYTVVDGEAIFSIAIAPDIS